MMQRLVIADFLLQSEKRIWFENAEGKILEFVADDAHAQTVRDGRVDLERLARDALLLVRLEILDSAHVVQAIGQLHDHHANIVDHGQDHLADVFGLARFGSEHVEAADFGYAFDETGGFFTESFLNARDGKFSVLNHVVEKSGGKSGRVHAHVGENVRDFEKMGKIGIAGTSQLIAMAFCGNFVSAAYEPRIVGGAILLKRFEKFVQASVQQALRAVPIELQWKIGRAGHLLILRLKERKGERGEASA